MSTKTMTHPRHAAFPSPRKAHVSTSSPAPAADKVTSPASTPNSLSYLDFLYGFGAGPGIDLGLPKAYTQLKTATGCVFREDFDRGIALCNCGDDPAVVTLEKAYYDEDGTAQTSVTVPPHTVKVFVNEP